MRHVAIRVVVTGILVTGLMAFGTGVSVAQSAGELLFKTKCAACHGPDGKGEVPMGKRLNIPNLGSAEIQKLTDAQLAQIITKGKNKMPAYADRLTKEQVHELVTCLRELGKKH